MENKLNTFYEFEFEDGSKVKMTLAFYAIYQLKSKNISLYNRYNLAMNNLSKNNAEELSSITILYTAYVCANMNEQNLMSEEEFIIKCGSDRGAVGRAAKALTQPKKAQASGKPS